jgi:phosphoglycerate dehydrogenase-like enzyme
MKILAITDMIVPDIDEARLAEIAKAAGPGAEIAVARTPKEAVAAAPGTEVVFGLVHEALATHMPGLKWVQATSSGVDFMLFPALKQGDIVVTCEKGMVGTHLADHAMALLLALTRRVAEAVRDGPESWKKRRDYRLRQIELEGLTLGIIGLGGTGQALARRAAGFGMTVRAVDREEVEGTAEVAAVEPLDKLDEMLGACDVVAICAPLTRETAGMFDDARFAAMKPGAFLINVTRGELVDTDALYDAIKSGHLGGAGLDVLDSEPLPPRDPLWRLRNVVMTPHTAGASQLRAGRNIDRFIENLGRYRRGKPLIGVVDKTLGY